MHFEWFLLSLVCAGARAAGWRWPAEAESVRIDTKVRFLDDDRPTATATSGVQIIRKDATRPQNDEESAPFKEPMDTVGFYNRPGSAGRFPVRVEDRRGPYRVDGQGVYHMNTYSHRNQQGLESDGTLDSLQFCKCVNTPECNPRPESARACGSGKFLCCYKRPHKNPLANTEFFNEIEDERPMLLPGQQNLAGPFPHSSENEFGLFGHGVEPGLAGSSDPRPQRKPDLLIGPEGPTGQYGPARPVLVGPDGPSGHIGPAQQDHRNQNVLVGPNGATGQLGPAQNPAVLVGPEGPTGVIGPANNLNQEKDIRFSGTAQRGVLVGPGGPTGIIGPYQQRGVLVGPGGPSGIIGPNRGFRGMLSGPGGPTGIIGPNYGRRGRPGPGLLVGPGGPTGIIGPGRQLLVGPGGPTGQIGPRRYYGN